MSWPPRVAAVAAAALVLLGPGSASGQAPRDDLFERVFGRRPGAGAVTLPLSVDGRRLGELAVVLDPAGESFALPAAGLIETLAGIADPGLLARLGSLGEAADGRLTGDDLRAAGLSCRVAVEVLELHCELPAALRGERVVALRTFQPPPALGEPVLPSPLSAVLTARAATELGAGDAAPRLDLDGAVQLHGWVLEGRGVWDGGEGPGAGWDAADLRLIHDRPERALRFSAGEIAPPAGGAAAELLGVGVARDFSLQPYRVIAPRGEAAFQIDRPATVEVMVNGLPVQTLELAPGRYRLRDLYLLGGLNEVRLVVEDDLGRREVVAGELPYADGLLASGLHQFAYVAGVEPRSAGGRAYGADRPLLSAVHRAGLSPRLTVGGALEAGADHGLARAEALAATAAGTWALALEAERLDGITEPSLRLGYERLEQAAWGGGDRFRAEVAVRDRPERRSAAGEVTLAGGLAGEARVRFDRVLAGGLGAGLGVGYRLDPEGDTPEATLSLRRRLGRRTTAAVAGGMRTAAPGERESFAAVQVSWRPRDPRHLLSTSADSAAETARLDWSYRGLQAVQRVEARAGLSRGPERTALTADLRYEGYRGEIVLSGDAGIEGAGGTPRGRVLAAASLVGAGGRWALTRPVTGSFVLLAADGDLDRARLGTGRIGDRLTSRTGPLGPAVIPDLTAYEVRNVTVEAPDLPPGRHLGESLYSLRPSYRSGSLIRLGAEERVLVGGLLVGAGGAPLALRAGELIGEGERAGELHAFFTNRAGRFRVDGVPPGSYRLRLLDGGETARLEVPSGVGGAVHDGGRITAGPPPDAAPGREETER